MSYEPTNWKTGDVVTSAKLNKLEQGVAGGVLVAHLDEETGNVDKTWQEIYDALADGKTVTCFVVIDGDFVAQNQIFATNEAEPAGYEVRMFDFDARNVIRGGTYSKDGYPQFPH